LTSSVFTFSIGVFFVARSDGSFTPIRSPVSAVFTATRQMIPLFWFVLLLSLVPRNLRKSFMLCPLLFDVCPIASDFPPCASRYPYHEEAPVFSSRSFSSETLFIPFKSPELRFPFPPSPLTTPSEDDEKVEFWGATYLLSSF